MKHRAFTWIEIAVILSVLGIIAAILWPALPRNYPVPKRAICQSNLKQIGLAFHQYVQDYDEKFPQVASSGTTGQAYGWADALQPYLKSTQVYQCPAEPTPLQSTPDPTQAGYTDYWFNSNLSGVPEKKLNAEALTILSGDGNTGKGGTDACYAKSHLPSAWRTDQKSPVWRHPDGANYLFADGHVKQLKPDKVQDSTPVAQGKPTFSWK